MTQSRAKLLYDALPPDRLDSVGVGSFEAIGEGFLREFKERCELKPDSSFLDIGSGLGRLAIPLTQALNENGRYEGFDITPDNVKWCQDNITPTYPNFNFQIADIFNTQYNPEGTQKPAEYQFPYPDNLFDVACAASVFTHLLSPETQHYIAETARVLKPGGYFLSTFFLLNSESREALAAGKSSLPFVHEMPDCLVVDPSIPEAAVAYDVQFMTALYERVGLVVQDSCYGLWSGRTTPYGGYQDMIVARKS